MEYCELETICRSCMTSLSNLKYNLLEEPQFANFYQQLSSTLLEANDSLPKFICPDCQECLEKFESFRRKCIESYQVLSNRFVLQDVSEEVSIKEEIPEILFVEKQTLESFRDHENDEIEIKPNIDIDNDSDYDPLKEEIKSEQPSSSDDDDVCLAKFKKPKRTSQKSNKPEDNKQKIKDEENKICPKKPNFPFTCEICSRYFFKELLYEGHMRVHRGLKPFACKLCYKDYQHQPDYNAHMLSEHSETPLRLPCTFEGCDKVYKTKRSLKQHLYWHFNPNKNKYRPPHRKYVCETCGKTLASKSSWKLHSITHTNEYPLECDICHMRFRSEYILSKHKINKHDFESKFVCPVCGTKKGCSLDLRVHMKSHSDQKLHKCKTCSITFQTSSELGKHTRAEHEKIKQHFCTHCGKGFAFSRYLTLHIRRHTGEKAFKCTVCDFQMNRKEVFEQHMERHMKASKIEKNEIDNMTTNEEAVNSLALGI